MTNGPEIGNRVAPWRFITFIVLFLAGAFPAREWTGSWGLGVIDAFDTAAVLFLLLCWGILRIDDPAKMQRIAQLNDANRTFLLIITAIVMAVLLTAVADETVGRNPSVLAKALIITTLIVAWLFSNTIYALHYAHMAYRGSDTSCTGFRFPETPQPIYWDFVYFSFTCGMAFATSDVQVTDQHVRKIVAFHCLAAFAFNIGVLAFTVNLLASGAG